MQSSPSNTGAEKEPEFVLNESDRSSLTAKRVAVGAILGASSIAVAPLAEFLPRMPWGIALFDPVSFFWIIAFLVGGIWVGSISTIAGTFALFLYDPTGIGPFYKLMATLPFIVVPYVGVRLRKCDGAGLSRPGFFFLLMLAAYIVRIMVMVPVNLVTIPLFMPFVPPEDILPFTIILNTNQSFWDALIPFLVVHRTAVFRNFRLW